MGCNCGKNKIKKSSLTEAASSAKIINAITPAVEVLNEGIAKIDSEFTAKTYKDILASAETYVKWNIRTRTYTRALKRGQSNVTTKEHALANLNHLLGLVQDVIKIKS